MLSLPDFEEKQLLIIENNRKRKVQFSNDNLVLRNIENNLIENKISCYKLFAVFFIGDATLTSVVLRKAAHYGFTIIFMRKNLHSYASVGSQTEGNYLLRRLQYKCHNTLELSKHIVQNKLENQLSLIQKIRKKTEEEKKSIQRIKRYIKLSQETEDEKSLLGIEGYVAKIFFQTYFNQMQWKRRQPRTKSDALNTLLDMGYTHLFHFIEAHLRLYGFDLYMGVYHKLFYQRKALVCDLIEPFRCLIDQKIRKMYHLKQIQENDFLFYKQKYLVKPKEIKKI